MKNKNIIIIILIFLVILIIGGMIIFNFKWGTKSQPKITETLIFDPPIKIGIYEIEFLEGAAMLSYRENRFAKNEQEIIDALSTILPTGEKLAQGDAFGKWWIKNIEIQNHTARVYFGGDTEFITERSGSMGAGLIAAQITVALTEDERIKNVFLEIPEGSHLGPGPYTRIGFKDLLQTNQYYGFSTYGICQTNNDCFVSGCNSEICQSRIEEPIASICILPDRSTPQQLDYECQCLVQRCQWVK